MKSTRLKAGVLTLHMEIKGMLGGMRVSKTPGTHPSLGRGSEAPAGLNGDRRTPIADRLGLQARATVKR
jgi:hypothetical protein